mmetsp:Transcript_7303/g.22261  ORF Transcript_7303/g.22261 Transcript_7303/m.22261 type:complete len:204 (-) Transcript_7303:640-1251(-)
MSAKVGQIFARSRIYALVLSQQLCETDAYAPNLAHNVEVVDSNDVRRRQREMFPREPRKLLKRIRCRLLEQGGGSLVERFDGKGVFRHCLWKEVLLKCGLHRRQLAQHLKPLAGEHKLAPASHPHRSWRRCQEDDLVVQPKARCIENVHAQWLRARDIVDWVEILIVLLNHPGKPLPEPARRAVLQVAPREGGKWPVSGLHRR